MICYRLSVSIAAAYSPDWGLRGYAGQAGRLTGRHAGRYQPVHDGTPRALLAPSFADGDALIAANADTLVKNMIRAQ